MVQNESRLNRMIYTWTKSKVFWFMFGSFTSQGGRFRTIKKSRSRLLVSIWLLSVLTIASSYGGTLISFLTRPTVLSVPSTVHELASDVTNGAYSCGTEYASAVTKLVLGSQSGDAKILANNVKENNNIYTLEKAFNRVLNDNFVFISKDYILSKFVDEHGPANFLISKDSFLTLPTAYLMRKDFQYRRNISKILVRLLEAGITRYDDYSNGDVGNKSEVYTLSIEHLFGAFYLLFLGYVLSISCLFVECIIGKKKIPFIDVHSSSTSVQ
ncbi:glutamate receptor ionotropic, delta-2-like [Centruroides sculpturatus]|uniref:glutamate receptor ionotropic, delta-2-like n=1 Tax=Centruroides sculpturatus TaxID=218467 RepID=UPI000C6EF910|nr:glutamate receptor ionotropic, delta-2-like [Centruroides sculpturatus]